MNEKDTKTQQKAPDKKGNKVLKTILNTVINILIVLVLIVSILVAVLALTSKANGVSTIFGKTIQVVQTDSMKGGSKDYEGGDFEEGDIIIGKATGEDGVYEVGDIVTYVGQLQGMEEAGLITHRIIGVDKLNGEDSSTVYQTKGDNNFDADQENGDTFQYIPAKDIKSLYYSKDFQGTTIKGLGKILSFVQSQMGFFLVVLLPMIIFFLYELVRVVMNAVAMKNEKAKEEMEESEEERQAAIDAAVAKALAEKDHQTEEKISEPAAPTNMTPEELEQFRQFQEFQKLQKAQQEAQNASTEPQTAEDTPSKE